MKTKRGMGQRNVARGAAHWEAKTFILYGVWKTTFKYAKMWNKTNKNVTGNIS